jgi:DNA-binding transcriptional ArsR family regulator
MAGKPLRHTTPDARPARPEPKRVTAVSAAPKDAQSLDRLIHDRVRLGILSALAGADSLSFGDLKSALDLSDGNLSVHARKLEEAGYVTCEKSFAGRLPRTEYRLAPAGRRAFEKYLNHMDALITAARKARP